MYRSYSPSRRQKPGSQGISIRTILIGIIVLFLALIVVLAMVLMRSQEQLAQDDARTQVEDVTPSTQPTTLAATPAPAFEEIQLKPVGTAFGGYSAIARRGAEGEKFTLVVVADLPAVDSASHQYEVWLVKPGIVDYFSVGTMFAREDGRYGMLWETSTLEAKDDPFLYSEVIVTREIVDNNPDPSPTHALEGEF